jgi:hypothetical protein
LTHPVRAAAWMLALIAGTAVAQPSRSAENNAGTDEITPALEESVGRGLANLAATQNEDGSWSAGRFGKNVAITAARLPGRHG